MSLAKKSFVTAVVAPIALAAFGLAAANDAAAAEPSQANSCSMKYDAARGVFPGDCYQREEVAKFVCLNKNPANGPVSEACGKPDGQLPVYLMTRLGDHPNPNIFTSDSSKKIGYNLEKEGNTYGIRMAIDKPHFNNYNNPNIPAWANPATNPEIAGGKFNPTVALFACKQTGYADACHDHMTVMKANYDAGSRVIFGGLALKAGPNGKLVSSGKFVTLRLDSDAVGVVNLTDEFGANRKQFVSNPPVTVIADNANKLYDRDPSSTVAALEPRH